MKRNFMAVAAALVLAGCANLPATKDVVTNPQAHLATFAPATLRPEVLAKLPQGEPALGFQRMDFDLEASEVRSDDRRERDGVSATFHYVNAGNSLVQVYEEYRNNQVPYRINYRLTYRGLMQLKWQTVFHVRPNADMPYELKTVRRADPLAAPAGRDLEYDVSSGTQVQVAGFIDGRRSCTIASGTAPASQLHPSLQGSWRELACDNYGANGTVASKSTYAYLQQYGVAVPRHYADSSTRNSYKITAVRIE